MTVETEMAPASRAKTAGDRPHYENDRPLTAGQLKLEQDFGDEMREHLARILAGAGLAEGGRLSVVDGVLSVEGGSGFDAYGALVRWHTTKPTDDTEFEKDFESAAGESWLLCVSREKSIVEQNPDAPCAYPRSVYAYGAEFRLEAEEKPNCIVLGRIAVSMSGEVTIDEDYKPPRACTGVLLKKVLEQGFDQRDPWGPRVTKVEVEYENSDNVTFFVQVSEPVYVDITAGPLRASIRIADLNREANPVPLADLDVSEGGQSLTLVFKRQWITDAANSLPSAKDEVPELFAELVIRGSYVWSRKTQGKIGGETERTVGAPLDARPIDAPSGAGFAVPGGDFRHRVELQLPLTRSLKGGAE